MRTCTRVFWGVCILICVCLPAYATNVGGTISTNTVWNAANSPYVVTSNVTVNSSVTLTIEPGVQVYFTSGTGMYVSGSLICSGTSGSGIYFGSAQEMDTPSAAAPGDWKGITFQSSAASTLSYCTIAYATTGAYCNDSSSPTISSCTFTSNSGYPISSYCNNVQGKIFDNGGSGNISGNVIELRGGNVTTTQTWKPQPLTYQVTGNITVYGAQNDPDQPCVLTLDPGVIVRFNSGCGLDIGRNWYGWWYGALVCAGTSGNGVLLSSSSSTPAQGLWHGVRFYEGIRSDLTSMTYTTVEYGGQGTNGGINCYTCSPAISNCTIINNANNGIYGDDNASPIITDCILNNNALYPITTYPNYTSIITGNSGSGNGSGDVIAVRGGNITTTQTWQPQPLTYRVIGNITVYGVQNDPDQPCVLTLDPGVIVRFNSGCGLDIGRNHYGWWYGALVCAGTFGNGVLLSSSSSTPAPGSWHGVRFYDGIRDDLTSMTYTTVEYAGQSTNGGINCYTCSPTISNCTIINNANHGIYANDDASPMITDSVLNNNALYPITVYPNYASPINGNSGSGNGSGDVIELRGGNVTTSQTWRPQPLTYRATGNIAVYGVQNDPDQPCVLTLDPGVIVRFDSGCGLDISRNWYGWWYGALVCAGTSGNGVLLSSSSTSSPGSWHGVRFYAGTRSDLASMTYTTVEYAGQNTNGGINCYGSNPSITDCTVHDCLGSGIYADNDACPYITDCILNNNSTYPISEYCNNIQGRLTGNTGSGNISGDYIEVRSGDITTSQTWVPQPLVYRVTGSVEVYGVQNDATKPCILTLAPGTTVKFNSGCGLYMGRDYYGPWYGALACEGTESSHVTLTGMTDTPGSWLGVIFREYTDDADSILTYTDISYGGQSTSANVRCESSAPTLTNCSITNSSSYGVYADNGGAPYLHDNVISDNASYAVSEYCNNILGRLTGNTGSGNGSGNVVLLRSGAVTTSQTYLCEPLPYRVAGDIAVYGVHNDPAQPCILTIEAGTKVEFNQDCNIVMGRDYYGPWYGALACAGTNNEHVILTGTTESPGSWDGICFKDQTDDVYSVLEYTEIRYAGSGTYASNIRCQAASPTITNCILSDSSAWALYCDSSASPKIIGNVITGCNGGIRTVSGSAAITNNTIVYNTGTSPAISASSSSAAIDNNIVAFNNYGISVSSGSVSLHNNDVFSNTNYQYSGIGAGSGDVSVNPKFANAAIDDYHLQIGSECIDMGYDTAVDPEWYDFDYEPRINGSHVDIGADEFYNYDASAPDTVITGGPAEGSSIDILPVFFTCSGVDDTSAAENLDYSWRIDGGDWSEFSAETSKSFDDLSEGDHIVEVKARDEAGNVDPTPAIRHFHTSVQRVLLINVDGEYNTDGENLFTTLQNAGANAVYVLLDSEGEAASLINSIDFDQIWVFDLSADSDDYVADWQAIADWYDDHSDCAIICDARIISSYWHDRMTSEGQRLTENYYYNLKENGGGLMLGTDHDGYQMGINIINVLIGLEPFQGNFNLTYIPVDTASPLMTEPNDMGTQLNDDSTPGQTPYGLQPNGRILYTVAWHSGNTDTPGISSTIRGAVGFHSNISSPSNGSSHIYGADINFTAATSGGAEPYSYQWSSDLDGVLSTDQNFTSYALSVGTHIITLRSTDNAGRIDEVGITVYVNADQTAPNTSITGGPNENAYICSDSTAVSFIGSDNATPTSRLLYRWSLDGDAWSSDISETTVDLTDLSTGSHTFSVAAIDSVGNVDASPAVRHFNVFLDALEITDINVNPSQGDAVVTWATPIPADSMVEYGTTESYEMAPISSAAMVTGHSLTLTGLEPSMTYHYRLTSTDACGRTVVTDDDTFTTPALPNLSAEFLDVPAVAYSGLNTHVKWQVANTGSIVTMKNWIDCIYLSSDDQVGDDVQLTCIARPLNLQPGADYSQTITYTLPPVSAGSYWIILKADSENSQPETDEDDNIVVSSPVDVRVMDVPVIASIADDTATEGVAYTGPTPVLTSGTPPVTWSLIEGPTGMTIDQSTGVVSWPEPKGLSSSYKVTIQATNEAGAGIQTWQITVPISYTATVSADIDSDVAGTPVHLTGSATWVETHTPAQGMPVTVRILVKDTRRVYRVTTDASGNFSYTFVPLANEAGVYSVAAGHPGVEYDTIQDTFVLYGMATDPTKVSYELIPETPVNDEVQLKNLGDVSLTGITATVLNAPANLSVDVNCPASLDDDESAALSYTLTAHGDQDMSGTIAIEVECNEGATTAVTMPIHIKPARPVLTANPGTLQAAMLRGTQTLVQVDITNTGGVASTDLSVAVPSASWLTLSTPAVINPIAPGGKASIVLSLIPSDTQGLGIYDGTVVISSSTANLTIPFHFNCVSDKTGDLTLTAVDEFSYYAAGNPNVADAEVTLTRVDDPSIVISGTTDAGGVAEFYNLPEAYYNVKVQALEHGPFTGSLLIEADKNREVLAFLPRSLVSYVWKVVPTQIEDKYKIVLEALFETNVPAPVVTVEPANIDLSEMVGGKMQIDLTITNHGLIAAEDVELQFGDHPKYLFKPLTNKIGILAANTSVVVPLTIVDIDIFPEETQTQAYAARSKSDVRAMGGSSDPCIKLKAGVLHVLKCGDDGKWKWIPINVVYPENVCPGSGTRPASCHWWGIGGGGGGGGWTGGGGAGTATSPYVSSSYVLTEPVCDPCMDKLGSCLMSFLPIGCVGGAVSSAGTAIYGCIGADWISCTESILNAIAGTIVGCLDDVPIIGTAWNIYNCIKDMYSACWSTSTSSLSTAMERYNSLTGSNLKAQDAGDDLRAAAAYLELQADRIKPVLDLYTEIFGDEKWLSGSASEGSLLASWYSTFYDATGESTPDGKLISEDERANLLSIARPSQLTDDDVNKFLDRWNRTMEYYAAGIGIVADVPEGGSTDFIPGDEFKAKLLDAKESIDELQAEGFTEIFGGLAYATDEFIDATHDQDAGVCARVKIQIEQEAVVARNAFKASLELDNAGGSPLEDIKVVLNIEDEEGNESKALFGIPDPTLEGISDVDGEGSLSSGTNCMAEWLLVPSNDAAPTDNKIYYVGATLSYTLNGAEVSVPIYPDAITVKPNPSLHLSYFMQKYVYSDDPFTTEVEPAEPFGLGLIVNNSGYGTAYDFQITSAQPKIIENEKGLLIDFNIIGTQVGTQEVSPSLTADFGDIAPHSTAVARWFLTSSLQGRFIDYNATYEHITALGDTHVSVVEGEENHDLSLINGVDIHEMIHVVRMDIPSDDNMPDFLVNDTPDTESMPDIVYSSDGTTEPVSVSANASTSGTLSPTNLSVRLTASPQSGWCYIEAPDPGAEIYTLMQVIRSDGRIITVDDNAWTTHRTIRKEGQDPYRQHIVHIFDYDSTGDYTLIYEKATSSTTASLAKLEADGTFVMLGEDESLIVTAVFDGYFYVEPTDRVCGMRVTWSGGGVSLGDRVTIKGTMGTTASFERCVIADEVNIIGQGITIEPFIMTNCSLGGCDLEYDPASGAGQRGVKYCEGANNIGLLVKTTGTVTALGNTYFYIDDGTHAKDGSIFRGVRVLSGMLTKPSKGDYVTVTGISSILRVGNYTFRSITPRFASDIEITGP